MDFWTAIKVHKNILAVKLTSVIKLHSEDGGGRIAEIQGRQAMLRRHWLEPFRFHVNCIHFREAVFVHVGQARLCTGNGVSFHMCSAVEVAWLETNIRHSSTRV